MPFVRVTSACKLVEKKAKRVPVNPIFPFGNDATERSTPLSTVAAFCAPRTASASFEHFLVLVSDGGAGCEGGDCAGDGCAPEVVKGSTQE